MNSSKAANGPGPTGASTVANSSSLTEGYLGESGKLTELTVLKGLLFYQYLISSYLTGS